MQVLGQSQNKRSSTWRSSSPRQVNSKEKKKKNIMLFKKKKKKKNEKKTHRDTQVHIHKFHLVLFFLLRRMLVFILMCPRPNKGQGCSAMLSPV